MFVMGPKFIWIYIIVYVARESIEKIFNSSDYDHTNAVAGNTLKIELEPN